MALALAGFLLIYLAVTHVRKIARERELFRRRMLEKDRLLEQAYQRLQAIFHVSQTFDEASDEGQVIEPVMDLIAGLQEVKGAIFTLLDEYGHPLSTYSRGDNPLPLMETWQETQTGRGLKEYCQTCERNGAASEWALCSLIKNPFFPQGAVLCLPVKRRDRDFGLVNLFLSGISDLDRPTRDYLRMVIDEAAAGLEGVWVRRKELAALRQLNVLRQKADLSALLNSLLRNIARTLDADFAIMNIPRPGEPDSRLVLSMGDLAQTGRPFLEGILQGVMDSKDPILLGEVAGDPASFPSAKSLISAPLVTPEHTVVGAVLFGTRRSRGFHQRQLALLQTIAGQIAVVVENADLIEEMEYKSMLQERIRLAREIHDGLAQILGLVKIQAGQIRGYLSRGELERAQQTADVFYATLAEAYQDARQAIDNLRLTPDESGLTGWLRQTVDDFKEISGLPVELEINGVINSLPPEIHAHLIRIAQEALSNVRKHARAKQAWVSCQEKSGDLILEIRDDGEGFSPEDVEKSAQHGLRGMRERTELIGGDFQIISFPQKGTTVRLRLPLKDMREVV